jgi:hypothetical protein
VGRWAVRSHRRAAGDLRRGAAMCSPAQTTA